MLTYIRPPLKSAMVFGGIAGIVTSEAGENDDSGGPIPSISSKTRELSELQDMYRRTLAASWACKGGELPPDKLIEDIFAGGNGGLMPPPEKPRRRHEDDDSDSDSRRTIRNLHTDSSGHPNHPQLGHHNRNSSKSNSIDVPSTPGMGSVSGRGSIDQQIQHSTRKGHGRNEEKDFTEFDVREDLRSWSIETRG